MKISYENLKFMSIISDTSLNSNVGYMIKFMFLFLSFIFSKIDFSPLNHVPPLVEFYLEINAQPTREWKVDFI